MGDQSINDCNKKRLAGTEIAVNGAVRPMMSEETDHIYITDLQCRSRP